MAKSLLERAKSIAINKRTDRYSEDQLELITAWLNDEISVTQICQVLGFKTTGNVYVFLARGARQIFQEKK